MPRRASAYVRIVHAGRPWSSRTTTNIKTEHNLYLACEDSPQRAFFFCTFSCSRLALLASTVHWLLCILVLNAANRRLRSVLDSAKCVRCGGPTALSYPSSIVKKRRSSLSSTTRQPASGILPYRVSARDVWVLCVHVNVNWHSWAWQTCTYIVGTYVCTLRE